MAGTVIGFPRFVEIRERHRARAGARPAAGRRPASADAPPPGTIEGDVVAAIAPPEPGSPAASPEMDARRGPAHRGRPRGGEGLRPFPARP